MSLSKDLVVDKVIHSEPFLRLRSISFLGALDHIAPICRLKKSPRSRADHSLHVAALASFVAEERGYSDDLKRHLVIAGLLHDIGHPPLSHSVEPYLKKQFGYGHHEMGVMVMSGRHKSSAGLHKILSNKLDVSFVSNLIAGDASDAEGGDLFSSPINIDTIEGIIRSYRYLKDTPTSLNPLDVALASFVSKEEGRFRMLDNFWKMKGYVYNQLINRDVGLVADQYSQMYFENTGQQLVEGELFENERRWLRRHSQLFKNLSTIHSAHDVPEILSNMTLEYCSRHYEIQPNYLSMRRYQCVKQRAWTKLRASANNNKREQLIISL
ncbi:HD domain-containing protein [Nitrincola sp. MINF-07-Sa-05]|uniref:HD domain-containing protein n=1 Tax=Nitrincola salilacus TaxID=3400273 RepID=UPI003917ED3C